MLIAAFGYLESVIENLGQNVLRLEARYWASDDGGPTKVTLLMTYIREFSGKEKV